MLNSYSIHVTIKIKMYKNLCCPSIANKLVYGWSIYVWYAILVISILIIPS